MLLSEHDRQATLAEFQRAQLDGGKPIRCKFTRRRDDAVDFANRPLNAEVIKARCSTADVCTAKRGSTLVVEGEPFGVEDLDKDQSGFTTLTLVRRS